MPELTGFTKVYDRFEVEPLKTLKQAFFSPFSLEWFETYVSENNRKALSFLFSDLLSETLPAKEIYFSEPEIINEVFSISVFIPPLKMDLLLNTADSKILSITVSQ